MKDLQGLINSLHDENIRLRDVYKLLRFVQQNFEDYFPPLEEVMFFAREKLAPNRLSTYLHHLNSSRLDPKIKNLLLLYD